MDDDTLLAVLTDAAAAVRAALDGLDDWKPAGVRPGQYRLDLVADRAALRRAPRCRPGRLVRGVRPPRPDGPP